MHARWNTYRPGNTEEARVLEEISRRIDLWWEAFAGKAAELDRFLRGESQCDLTVWVREHLSGINPDLQPEFSAGVTGGNRLVITPAARLHLHPLVDEIIRRAPKLENWSFHGYRPAEGMPAAGETIRKRTGQPPLITGIRCARGQYNQLDLTFEFPAKILKKDADLAQSQAVAAAEAILGEQTLNAWIGKIEIGTESPVLTPLSMLVRCFTAVRSGIIAAMPAGALYELPREAAVWTAYELMPNHVADYPAQLDLFSGRSMHAEMWRAAHAGAPFHSERFTARNERFCYIKMDGYDASGETGAADKAMIGYALDETLRGLKLGCVVGEGSGLRYSYLDLALPSPAAAFTAIGDQLRAFRVPHRSWLHFFDSEWEQEWVGVYEDSPPPPMPREALAQVKALPWANEA